MSFGLSDGSVSSLGANTFGVESSIAFGAEESIIEKELNLETAVDINGHINPNAPKKEEPKPEGNNDEEENEEDAATYKMEVMGMKCPKEFVNVLTPMEFEEIVDLFLKYDVDSSGTIDKHEARKILESLGMESSLEESEKMLAIVDSDGSGEISFPEYCRFIVMIKEGDERFEKFGALLSKVHNTPLGELEKQAKLRNLTTKFNVIEMRENSAGTETTYILELLVTGDWYEIVEGRSVAKYQIKRFQGIGKSLREAKYVCATLAVSKFGNLMPGLKFEPGYFPEEWTDWIDENLSRGVDPASLSKILSNKGFHLNKNIPLMQRIIVWQSLDKFLKDNPDFDITGTITLDVSFEKWVRGIVERGIDGRVLLGVLKDRLIHIEEDHLLFAQKISSNELGALIDKNGKGAKLLDFWLACEEGHKEDVEIYCNSGQNLEEEKIGRHTSEILTPLMLAAQNGHNEVVHILLEHGALPNSINRRGRTALHLAAYYGHEKACAVLLGHNAQMFLGDIQGNTPLHYSVMGNHIQCTNYLAFKGVDFVRNVVSDKVRPRPEATFDNVVEEVFYKLQDMKLHVSEQRRFEKTWLSDASELFIKLMSPNTRHMLPIVSVEVQDDVLMRFDPRPETGIFTKNNITGLQKFIPIVKSAIDLSVLLKNCFRQSSIDSLNSWKRTPLQIAAEMNQLNSYEGIITILLDVHGVNSLSRDMHSNRAIDLLIVDKNFALKPSATRLREEFLMKKREDNLKKISDDMKALDLAHNTASRKIILDDCLKFTEVISNDLWDTIRNGSAAKGNYGPYEVYEDSDTLNPFYTKIAGGSVNGNEYSDYSHFPNFELQTLINKKYAIEYQRKVNSKLLRVVGPWIVYKCKSTKVDYYYNEEYDYQVYRPPKETSFTLIQKDCKVEGRLGFHKEWQVLSKDGAIFYRHFTQRICYWDKPIDAIEVKAIDRFCTGHNNKGIPSVQTWYNCEECNRALKLSGDAQQGTIIMPKFCEPCIVRCHKGHKGVKLVRESNILCNCELVCKIINRACCALVVSKGYSKVQVEAFNHRLEASRLRELDALMPSIYAMVPPYNFDGSDKRKSGWMICRRCPPNGLENFGNWIREEEMSRGDINTVAKTEATLSTRKSDSLVAGVPTDESIINGLLSVDLHSFPYDRPEGLPDGWIEVVDSEEPEIILDRARVVVTSIRSDEPPKRYATVLRTLRKDVFRVLYDDNFEDTVGRYRIEVISKEVFFFNPSTGQSAWTIDDACMNPFDPGPMTLTGPEWHHLFLNSFSKRTLDEWEHMSCGIAGDMIYYLNTSVQDQELACLVIQRWYRQKRCLDSSIYPWATNAYFIIPPPELVEKMKTLQGWAYLRRRSRNCGEFLDIKGIEWEEYVDKVTSQYFYWNEDQNLYSWTKPEVPDRGKNGALPLFEIGSKFLYVFPGRRVEELATITGVRFDDETGEDMYDIECTQAPLIKYKWIHRMRLKPPPMGSDELLVQRAEKEWKSSIRKFRDRENRRLKREKELQMQAEIERLARKKSKKTSQVEEISDATKILRGRFERIKREELAVLEKLDEEKGIIRREIVRIEVEKKRTESPVPLSRAEVLSITRALDLKFQMAERIETRNAIKSTLAKRRQEIANNAIEAQNYLERSEIAMTSPRSLQRRKVIRKVHVAMQRQLDCYMICEWGCGDWVRFGPDQMDHQQSRCPKRILSCSLFCSIKKSEEEWLKPQFPIILTQDEIDDNKLKTLKGEVIETEKDFLTVQQYHEDNECVKRLVECPNLCLEWITFEKLDHHITDMCTKRPAKPLLCRIGCDAQFGGTVEQLIEAEDERLMHETEQCLMRMVRCNWKFDDGRMCAAQLMAKDREEHKDYHLSLMGITTFKVPGTFMYRVPKKVTRLKVQCWGAGGGSGYFRGRQVSDGGGGAFVEVFMEVIPHDTLEIVIGSGGSAGVPGTDVAAIDIDIMRKEMAVRRMREMYAKEGDGKEQPMDMEVVAGTCGVALGGVPGGGEGYGGGIQWACGGGGGYTIVAKRSVKGNQALIVAAGGGGGSSLHGLPGGGLTGAFPGTRIDPRNGYTATDTEGGAGGDSGTQFNSQWPASAGVQWQGGNGCEFGGGGGGGYFGGGGGGNSPGIGGGGGGGSSFVYTPKLFDYVVIQGHDRMPGGMDHEPPEAVGLGEWDKLGGFVGEGGLGEMLKCNAGNNGAVRIILPGHY